MSLSHHNNSSNSGMEGHGGPTSTAAAAVAAGGGGGVAAISSNSGGYGLHNPAASFLSAPNEDGGGLQELLRLHQTEYRVKMMPPPLSYAKHRRIWYQNEYDEADVADDEEEAEVDEDGHHTATYHYQQQQQQLDAAASRGRSALESPAEALQRLEAYKLVMQRWYSHVHVLESKPEVARRLARVPYLCPSLEAMYEVLRSNGGVSGTDNCPASAGQQQRSTGEREKEEDERENGAAAEEARLLDNEEEGAMEEMVARRGGVERGIMEKASGHRGTAVPPPPRGSTAELEAALKLWSVKSVEWWRDTFKRKSSRRQHRRQGSDETVSPSGGDATAESQSSSNGVNISALGMLSHAIPTHHDPSEGDVMIHNAGSGGYPCYSPPTLSAGGARIPSYASFNDIAEDGAEGHVLSLHPSAMADPSSCGGGGAGNIAAPLASLFPTALVRQGPEDPRADDSATDDFLENDHLALAFTTELLKSLEEE